MLKQRRQSAAFHPQGNQHVLFNHEAIFCLLRLSPDGRERVLCLQNVTAHNHQATFDSTALKGNVGMSWRDCLGGFDFITNRGELMVDLGPYQTLWLSPV
jgi:sucrose phosphorylase